MQTAWTAATIAVAPSETRHRPPSVSVSRGARIRPANAPAAAANASAATNAPRILFGASSIRNAGAFAALAPEASPVTSLESASVSASGAASARHEPATKSASHAYATRLRPNASLATPPNAAPARAPDAATAGAAYSSHRPATSSSRACVTAVAATTAS